jgi:hypothetical protein
VAATEASVVIETLEAGRNLLTPHPGEAYPGIEVLRPGPEWDLGIMVPAEGQTIVALGGERAYAYQTIDGGRAAGFELRPGDRATLMRRTIHFALAQWRIERA